MNQSELLNLLSEKKSKIGTNDSKEVVEILFKVYKEKNDMRWLCGQLSLACQVAELFTKKYYSILSEDERSVFCSAMFIENQERQVTRALPILFSIISAAVTSNLEDKNFENLFKKSLKYTEQKNGENNVFSEATCKAFKVHLLEKSKGKILNLNFHEWTKSEIQRLYGFIVATFESLESVPYKNEIEDWLGRYGFTSQFNNYVEKQVPVETKNPILKKEVNPRNAATGTKKEVIEVIENETTKTVEDNKPSSEKKTNCLEVSPAVFEELQKLFNNAFVKNNAFNRLESDILSKDKEIIELKREIVCKKKELASLTSEMSTLEKQLDQKKAEITNLSERLNTSFAFDDLSSKQEILTLKKDIASSLRLQYLDFSSMSDAPFSQDNYELYKTTLNQVFKVLKRYEIEL